MTDATNPPPVVEFLRARLDEAQLQADLCASDWNNVDWDAVRPLWSHIDRWDPKHVTADIAAKRAIIDIHKIYVEEKRESPNIKYSDTRKPDVGCVNCDWDNDCRAIENNGYPCDTVRLLAQPYADHPGYQAEWKVPR